MAELGRVTAACQDCCETQGKVPREEWFPTGGPLAGPRHSAHRARSATSSALSSLPCCSPKGPLELRSQARLLLWWSHSHRQPHLGTLTAHAPCPGAGPRAGGRPVHPGTPVEHLLETDLEDRQERTSDLKEMSLWVQKTLENHA